MVLHEIPQEIGDFGILLHAGFSRTRALAFNFLPATLAVLGVAAALIWGDLNSQFASAMVPITAGGFIYIAGSDLIPELQHESSLLRSAVQLFTLIAGIGLMLVLA